MSMNLLIAKIQPELRAELVSRGSEAVDLLFNGRLHPGFNPASDLLSDYDYRDMAEWVENPDHPIARLFDGEALIEGLEWTYGAPMYFHPDEAAAIYNDLADVDDWPFDEITDFLSLAVKENKGVIVGVA
jgi:hypothetical protein